VRFTSIIWDDEDDPDGNVEHIAQHGLSIEDVEQVLLAPTSTGVSRTSGLPVLWGYTPGARYIIVVYEEVDDATIYIITAFDVPEPHR
jgi:uncharacterized DUF497 family protein